jgi:hypothetical protein
MLGKDQATPQQALAGHLEPTPGKYEIVPSASMTTQRDCRSPHGHREFLFSPHAKTSPAVTAGIHIAGVKTWKK